MSSQRLNGGLITLCLILSCRSVIAFDAASSNPTRPNPAFGASPDLPSGAPSSANPPAMMALPANLGSGGDTSTTTKFYTLTASLREIYDDNVNTSHTDPISTFETQLSPSVLVNFPMDSSQFSARYTFDITYYNNYSGGNQSNNNSKNNGSGGSFDYTHEFVANYSHDFSDRFHLSLGEQFRYYTEPSVFESTGTFYRSGAYLANSFSGSLGAQWTPVFGTTTTFANNIVKYQDPIEAFNQDNVEYTASQTFSLAVLPKLNASIGGIFDDINYDGVLRGYTSYTGFLGGQWSALPSLNFIVRGGATYTETLQDTSSLSPYAAVSAAWTLGQRSGLTFDYAHEVTPSDQVGTNGQTSDRVSGNFHYDITSSVSTHLQLIYTKADYSSLLTKSSTLSSSYGEDDYAVDTGVAYHYNSRFDFDLDLSFSGVVSDSNSNSNSNSATNSNEYDREQVSVGVRGTY
jgi:hypothetical protein